MRLSFKEKNAITNAFSSILDGEIYRLYLFGSRAHDDRKGGDIDLLVVTEGAFKEKIVNCKSRIRLKIFESIPEQRIDITVATPEEMKTDSFLQSIRSDLIEI